MRELFLAALILSRRENNAAVHTYVGPHRRRRRKGTLSSSSCGPEAFPQLTTTPAIRMGNTSRATIAKLRFPGKEKIPLENKITIPRERIRWIALKNNDVCHEASVFNFTFSNNFNI